MTDITPDFNSSLKEKGAQPVVKKDYDIQTINSFLQEAYNINARIADLTCELRSIRPAYLSAAQPSRRRQIGSESNDRARPLSDSERDAIDAQSKLLLRQLNGAITGLKQVEDIRNQAADSVALSKRARSGLGAISRWAAGGTETSKSPEEERDEAARKTITAVRESIILFLQRKLEEAGRVQSEMMDVRLSREVEKTKSILAKSPISGGVPRAQDEDDDLAPQSASSTKRKRFSAELANGSLDAPARQELTQEQLQMFAEENSELLKHYEDQLDQVRTAERSILEISELHSTLHANLTQQSEQIEQLVQDSFSTTENLGRGNKELKRASERRSTAQAVFYSTIAFCSFLVVWDLVF
ncbi:hypothetical protein M409DRAFT_63296 [Zasmidium cellare ATCC 36951]|uniref:t-SNARE coiled-coil homology domain-containing protein n=1 Tax=Zasmidium cellare ATCC 36951 TaxID=1080233 RepID=A0A6A6CZN8_ZASCE|nr:uncharacterized protein M409DRAFT_63296 [Zasmidium cellare ATCC 36951]KAF2171670.1 hypothetical protein M409DRAFT_63296 [Zasmidium cellare ATCC 36951]